MRVALLLIGDLLPFVQRRETSSLRGKRGPGRQSGSARAVRARPDREARGFGRSQELLMREVSNRLTSKVARMEQAVVNRKVAASGQQ